MGSTARVLPAICHSASCGRAFGGMLAAHLRRQVVVDWAIQNHGRGDAVVAKPGGEGGCFPMAMGHGGAASLASGRTPVKAGHLGVRGGLVDEDDPGRIEVELSFKPSFARRVHRAATVRRRAPSFLRVILRRLKNRQSVPMATTTPRSFSRSRSSASVMSLLAATAERISSACASIRCEWRSPPWLGPNVVLAPFLSPPPDRARRAHAKSLGRRSTRQSALNRATGSVRAATM